jgi:hypothetical protein
LDSLTGARNDRSLVRPQGPGGQWQQVLHRAPVLLEICLGRVGSVNLNVNRFYFD